MSENKDGEYTHDGSDALGAQLSREELARMGFSAQELETRHVLRARHGLDGQGPRAVAPVDEAAVDLSGLGVDDVMEQCQTAQELRTSLDRVWKASKKGHAGRSALVERGWAADAPIVALLERLRGGMVQALADEHESELLQWLGACSSLLRALKNLSAAAAAEQEEEPRVAGDGHASLLRAACGIFSGVVEHARIPVPHDDDGDDDNDDDDDDASSSYAVRFMQESVLNSAIELMYNLCAFDSDVELSSAKYVLGVIYGSCPGVVRVLECHCDEDGKAISSLTMLLLRLSVLLSKEGDGNCRGHSTTSASNMLEDLMLGPKHALLDTLVSLFSSLALMNDDDDGGEEEEEEKEGDEEEEEEDDDDDDTDGMGLGNHAHNGEEARRARGILNVDCNPLGALVWKWMMARDDLFSTWWLTPTASAAHVQTVLTALASYTQAAMVDHSNPEEEMLPNDCVDANCISLAGWLADGCSTIVPVRSTVDETGGDEAHDATVLTVTKQCDWNWAVVHRGLDVLANWIAAAASASRSGAIDTLGRSEFATSFVMGMLALFLHKDDSALPLHAKRLRSAVLRVVANMTSRDVEPAVRRHNQDVFGRNGGLELVMNHCQLDEHDPYKQQWGILALRNLTEGSADNQAAIQGLELQEVANTDELDSMGLEATRDRETGKIRIRSVKQPEQ